MSALVLVRGLALGALILVLLAVAARRLLGLHVGWLRMLFAAAVGYTIAALATQAFGTGTQAFVLLVDRAGVEAASHGGARLLDRFIAL